MGRRIGRNSTSCRKNQSELISGLKELRHTIDRAKIATSQCAPNINSINSIHSKVASSEGSKTPNASQRSKLKQFTSDAIEEADVEIELLKTALAEINNLKELRGDKRHYLVPSRASDFFFCDDASSQQTGSDSWSALNPKKTMRRGALMTLLKETALALPLYTGDEPPPPLCGSIPPESNYVIPTGHYVAARVKTSEEEIALIPLVPVGSSKNKSFDAVSGNVSGKNGSNSGSVTSAGSNKPSSSSGDDSMTVNENWILAECLGLNNGGNSKYEIMDIDEDNKDCAKHVLGKRRVVPLPLMKADPFLHPKAVFQKGARVMALYPQTTCFYSAVVHESPQHATDEYRVLFEDSSYRDGYSPPLSVPVKFVVSVKELSGKKK